VTAPYDDAPQSQPEHEQHDAPRRQRVRGRTVSIKRLAKRDLNAGRLEADEALAGITAQRPRTRAECLPGGPNEARPCPWVSCAHHLALDVSQRSGAIKVNTPDVDGEPDWSAMPESCALDVADRGGMTLEEVGAVMNLTRERVRQLEMQAAVKVRRLPVVQALGDDEGLTTPRLPTTTMRPLSDEQIAQLEDRIGGLSLMTVAKSSGVPYYALAHALRGHAISAHHREAIARYVGGA